MAQTSTGDVTALLETVRILSQDVSSLKEKQSKSDEKIAKVIFKLTRNTIRLFSSGIRCSLITDDHVGARFWC